MSISALDGDTVKLITTTQVITSVSTAAKELIENAFDADAKNVEINLTNNGCTLIEVKDDGCGISKVDAPYMALSSYTSKIFNFSDLDSLETYGFRGEALYALSAVSDLTVITKTEEDEAATSYTIDHHGCITKSEPCHRSNGTTVQVRQLFKQVPVRRQIIINQKKANQDIKVLESLIRCYGICKYSVRISFKVDSNIIFAKPGTGTLEEAVTYILGKKVTRNMTWLDIKNKELSIKLMVPSKETQNVSEVFHNGLQYICVNDRPIKHKDLEKVVTKTITEALVQDSTSRKKPIFVLYISTDSINLDVNLEPNKTSILFKDQQMVLETVDKHLTEYYGIEKIVHLENACETSLSDYQDYTQVIHSDDVDKEWHACKKRRIQIEGSIDKFIERNVCAPEKCNSNTIQNLNPASIAISDSSEQIENSKHEQNGSNEGDSKCEKLPEDFNNPLPSLNLSDSDSRDSTVQMKKESTDDSPPFELTPPSEGLSQLPVVDLGEDFLLGNSSSERGTGACDKENKIPNTSAQIVLAENKLKPNKSITLDEWSRGHVTGLKGGTNVLPCTDAELWKDDSYQGNVCGGFLKFSKHIKSQVVEKNPTMTAPQIAAAVTKLWKKLSPEERGYYRDLACDGEIEGHIKKGEKKDKSELKAKKNKNRLLSALEKMKTMSVEKKENLVLRTTVPWEMDIKKVTESFLNNSTCKNTNFVVGLLHSNLWTVYKSTHIWVVDALRLKKELNVSDLNMNEETVESMEQLLKQWFSVKDDLSLLYPIHSLVEKNEMYNLKR